jgi:hypothetical protein
MTLEQFCKNNPTKEQVIIKLCDYVNHNALHIKELWCYAELADKYDIHDDDFYDDQSELTEYERNYIGLYNWKIKS